MIYVCEVRCGEYLVQFQEPGAAIPAATVYEPHMPAMLMAGINLLKVIPLGCSQHGVGVRVSEYEWRLDDAMLRSPPDVGTD